MCWSETPKGIFDSTRACEIIDGIVDFKADEMVNNKKDRLEEAISLLRSALSISRRNGTQTNWCAFREKVKSFLENNKGNEGKLGYGKVDYKTPLKRAELINEINKWYEKRFKNEKKEFLTISIFDLIADFVMDSQAINTEYISRKEVVERLGKILYYKGSDAAKLMTIKDILLDVIKDIGGEA